MANRATAVSVPAAPLVAPPPSSGRLAQLIEAAERRRLTPVEAGELRRGVDRLRACVADAGVQLRRCADEAERARDEHARRLLTAGHPALEVGCRRCGAAEGVWCRPVASGVMPWTLHVARLVDAGVLS